MKILHIEPFFHPELGYQVQQFARHHSADCHVVIVTSTHLGSQYEKLDKKELENKDQEFEKKTGAKIIRVEFKFCIRHKIWIKNLPNIVRSESPDIIFSHGVEYLGLVQLLLAGLHRDYPIVTDSHDLPTAKRANFLTALYRPFLRNYVVKKVNEEGITTYGLTNETRRLISEYGVDDSLNRLLPLGVDLKCYNQNSERRFAKRREIGILDDQIMLLYAGRLDFEKEPHFLIEALDHVAKKNESLKKCILCIAGSRNEDYGKAVFDAVLAHSRSYEIKILGRLSQVDLAATYSASDLVVFPKQNTLSALDAQSAGVPVVMEEDPTNSERLRHGGLTYAPGDLEDLGRQILKLIRDKKLRQQLGNSGSEFIQREYSYSNIVSHLEKELADRIKNFSRKNGAP